MKKWLMVGFTFRKVCVSARSVCMETAVDVEVNNA